MSRRVYATRSISRDGGYRSGHGHKRTGIISGEDRGPLFLYEQDSTTDTDQHRKVAILNQDPDMAPHAKAPEHLETRASERKVMVDNHDEEKSDPVNISQDSSGNRSTDFCHVVTNLTQDNTIHLEFDIVEDYEEYLEEFSRLKRFGRFKDAEEYFQRNLFDQIRTPRIAVEYADMLLEQGAINHYLELRECGILRRPEQAKVGDVAGELNCRNFRLIHDRFLIDAEGYLGAALTMIDYDRNMLKITMKWEGERKDQQRSIELQMYRHWLYIIAQGVQGSNLIDPSVFQASWPEWNDLYENLRSHERIWDFRDIFCAYLFAFGADEAWINFFRRSFRTSDCLKCLFADWSLEKCDESTYLAMLDVLLTLADCCRSLQTSSGRFLPTPEWCLSHARNLAGDMAAQNPGTVKSRSYLRWILMEEKYKRVSKTNSTRSSRQYSNFQYLEDYNGVILSTENVPIYVPLNRETPGWHIIDSRDGSDKLLETVLSVSDELGDYRTHAKCLGELVCHSSEPENLIVDLSKLLKSTGDMMGYIRILLSRYLLATDEDTCAALYLDLKKHSYTPHQDYPLLGWCRAVIEEALSHSVSHSQLDQNMFGLAGSISVDLPFTFHSLLLQRGFRKTQVRETEDSLRGYSLRWGSHWSDQSSRDRSPREFLDGRQPGSRTQDTATQATELARSDTDAPRGNLERKNEESAGGPGIVKIVEGISRDSNRPAITRERVVRRGAGGSRNVRFEEAESRDSSRPAIIRERVVRRDTTDSGPFESGSESSSSEPRWDLSYSDDLYSESDEGSQRGRASKSSKKKDKGNDCKVEPPVQTMVLYQEPPKLHRD
ncbi:hypothetical protein EAF04_005900 [Stromatinia cepivora]|nr:hypothetical protein EAF04_005900 [Stromatinia cepivora]